MKPCYLIIVFLVLLMKMTVVAQTTFQKAYSAGASWGIQGGGSTICNDGGYAICGDSVTYGSNLSSYPEIIKTDSTGNVVWAKVYDLTTVRGLSAIDVIQTPDDGFLLNCTAQLTNNSLVGGAVLKIDSGGEVEWAKYFKSEVQFVKQISGGYLVGSRFTFTKLNSTGDLIWSKRFEYDDQSPVRAGNATELPNGQLMLAGDIKLWHEDGDVCRTYMSLTKLEADGSVLWQKTYGQLSLQEYKHATAVFSVADGGFMLAGIVGDHCSSEHTGISILKTDSTGNLLWRRNYSRELDVKNVVMVQNQDQSYTLLCTQSKELTVYPHHLPHFLLIKMDTDGNLIWTRKYAGGANSYFGKSLSHTSDMGYAIGVTLMPYGYTYTDSSSGQDYHPFLIKTDSLGLAGCFVVDDTLVESFPSFQSNNMDVYAHDSAIVQNIYASSYSVNPTWVECPYDTTFINNVAPLKANQLISITPNPMKSYSNVIVNSRLDGTESMSMINLLGETVLQIALDKQTTILSRSNLSSGFYIFTVSQKKSIIYTGKLVVE